MHKIITMLLLSTGLSLGSLHAAAIEESTKSGSVEVIPLSVELVAKLRDERDLYEALVSRLVTMDEHAVTQNLDAVRNEYLRRVESIVHSIEAQEQPRHHIRSSSKEVVY